MNPIPRRVRRGVLPVHNRRGVIGTATAVAPGLALTALHVVAPEDPRTLRLGPDLAVRSTTTLPVEHYGPARGPADRSERRNRQLAGPSIDTVDLALLAVPGLRAPKMPVRAAPVWVGERVIVAGYPCGRWNITQGPVTGVDEADFAAQLLLGPGASGAPVLDQKLRMVGVVTLDHESATVCVGPLLVNTFLYRLTQ